MPEHKEYIKLGIQNFPNQNVYYHNDFGILYNGDVLEILKTLPSESIDTVITSPPYWGLRDYGIEGQIGLEPSFHDYLEKLWTIFDEVYRILKPTGTVWVNLGDTYFGSGGGNYGSGLSAKQGNSHPTNFLNRLKGYKPKCLCAIPDRFKIGMIDRGWICRNEIIWHKPNAMPESVKDRFTVDYEKIFFFVKQNKYYFEQQLEPYSKNSKIEEYKGNAIKDYKSHKAENPSDVKRRIIESMKKRDGRNKRCVWSINTKPFKDAHFAVFPLEIPEICIKAGCPKDGIVFDPFMGSGTTAVVAQKLRRYWIGIELNPSYCEIAKNRIEKEVGSTSLIKPSSVYSIEDILNEI